MARAQKSVDNVVGHTSLEESLAKTTEISYDISRAVKVLSGYFKYVHYAHLYYTTLFLVLFHPGLYHIKQLITCSFTMNRSELRVV